MTIASDRAITPTMSASYLQWGPIIAGAITAAALATVLHAFAGAIGLAVSSSAPTWRDASIGLMVLSGVYLVLVALASYGLGGYIAGLLRERSDTAAVDQIEFRDSLHGLIVWAVATLLSVGLLLIAADAGSRLSASTGPTSSSSASENVISFDIDRLLRDRRATASVDAQQIRGEVGRILLTSSGHTGVAGDDRAYLTRLVAAYTGLAPNDAERRVDTAIVNAKTSLSRARKSSVILAFMAGAAALIGAAAAWFAAITGGQHRDDSDNVSRWNILGRRVTT